MKKVLVNKGRRRLGIPGRPALILGPNEFAPIDGSQLDEIRRNRTVVRWLEVGILVVEERDSKGDTIKTKKFEPKPADGIKRPARNRIKTGDKREEVKLPEGVTGEGAELHHKGGGWYEVWVNGFKVTDRNVRKDEAEEYAKEYYEQNAEA